MHAESFGLSIDTYFMDVIQKEFDKNIENSQKSIVILMEKFFHLFNKIEVAVSIFTFFGE